MDPKIAPLANAANLSSNSGDDLRDRDQETTTLLRRNAKPAVRPESEFPHLEWTPGSKFTFFDYVRNVDVVGDEKRELKCITGTRCTLFSCEVFDIETDDFEETVNFPAGLLGSVACFGLVG